ncbi:magnesium transporter NIPA-domain-containing protein [Phialemonium atrogriseum]|uniref:Magnesium transporter NIPA-domain-containing protein n=1 Tax=Phialemonium atrogriseum TaxID=1093897 RepID=A0AAJ0FNR5_9PEZI|nr:magnesium transporter NIPA-domain-containing protein [Phialemonium atrogriseum]KAK1769289.1 magnesium transporter NIPA-domain-containing protein [Phialemonium atrogriseum]
MFLSTGSLISQRPTQLSFPFATPTISLPQGPGDHPEDGPGKEIQDWSSLIGIVTAIVGNILIALALNVQRYAHIRIHRRRAEVRERARQASKNAANGRGHGGVYGTTAPATNGSNGDSTRRAASRSDDEVEDARESDPLSQSFASGDSRSSDGEGAKVTSTYLKDPYWWVGQVLITVGEMGNFLAYGFAPASIVSPLGVVALISNCVIAPIVFKEVFRQRDFWGVIVAIAGAVTVVLSANQKETKLGPHDIWDAITTMEFEIYLGVSCALIALLMWASPRYGHRTVLIDLGLVGVFGGYTALATKGVSSMISSTLFGAFATPVTYALVFVLLSTAVMQVRYLNKALQRFDSTQVIPIQFVLFTLSVIIGSAVLYRDFERTTAHQAAKFVGGCLLTFFGVFLITSGRSRHDDDEDTLSDAEGVEETIGLAEHQATPQSPSQSSRRGSESDSTRRLSRVSFTEAVNKPLRLVTDGGIPTSRSPAAAKLKTSLNGDGHEVSPSPLGNPWLDSQNNPIQPQHPGVGAHTISSDSVLTLHSAISGASPGPGTPPNQSQPILGAAGALLEQPATPRPSKSSPRPHSSVNVRSGPMISPSPFSSTVSAVVADKLLPHDGSSRRLPYRRSRPSLMNGLFVPHDEAEGEEDGVIGNAAAQQHRHRRESDIPPGDGESWTDEDPRKGFRGRARTLSNTLGELLGVRRKRDAEAGEDDPLLAGSPSRPFASGSTETL